MKIGKINCLLCDNPICFIDGELVNFQSHLEYEHEVMVKKDLVLALSFLSENETKVLAKKIKPRLEYFLKHGEKLVNDRDIFDDEIEIVEKPPVKEQIQQIQDILNDDFSDSEDESLEKDDDDEVQIAEPPVVDKILEITIDDSDSEDESLNEDGESSENISIISKIKEENPSNIGEETKSKIMNKSVENVKREDSDISDSFSLEETSSNKSANMGKDTISIKPCNIMIRKLVTANPPYADQLLESVDDGIIEEGDLDSQQQQILQSVSCKMEIGENEVDEQEENWVSESDLNRLNLVDKLKGLNQCRLCFSRFSNKGNLKKHEETVHIDDQEALNLSFFTLTDLVYPCNMCPQVPGFLTENILNTHKKLQHRVQVKNTVAKCDVCQKVVKYHGLKSHMLTHEEKKYECNLCYRRFSIVRNMQAHQKSIHSKEAEYINKHLTELDLDFNCEVCNLKFVSDNVLTYHKKSHEKRVVFNCQFCTSSFEHPKMFKNHCIKVHGKRVAIDGSDKKFKCKLCYSGFSKPTNLEAHKKIHKEDQEAFERTLMDDDLKYTCSECEQRFISMNILNYHFNKNHKVMEFEELRKSAFNEEDRKFKCNLCYASFKHFSALHSHIMVNHEQEKALLKTAISDEDLKHACDECELKFLTSSVLEYHKSRVHVTKEKFVKCKICSKVVKKYSFPGHRLTHTSDRNHECQLCYVKFKLPAYLKKHQKEWHKSDVEKEFLLSGAGRDQFQIECGNCNLKFLTEDIMLKHQKKHEMEKLKNFNCQYCPRIFFKFKVYRKHVAEIHRKRLAVDQSEKKYGCKLCYRAFKFNGSLHDHMTKIHKDDLDKLDKPISIEDLKFKCEHCDQKFISTNIVEYHTEYEHKRNGIERECKLCYSKFAKRTYLIAHQKNVHKNETEFLNRELTASDLKFKCDLCEKKFVNEFLLHMHLKKHETQKFEFLRKEAYVESENRFNCKLCYTKFKFFSSLTTHINSVHREEVQFLNRELTASDLKFSCNECDQRFISVNILNYHTQYGHKSNDQESECKLCYKKFTKKTYLMNHQKSLHKNETEFLNRELTASDLKFSCNACEKKFVTKALLQSHLRKHQSQKFEFLREEAKAEDRFRCKLCYTEYKFFSELITHSTVFHREDIELLQRKIKDNELVHRCSECEHKFVTEPLLDYHHSKCHNLDKSTKCKLCDINFTTNSGFLLHKYKIHKLELAAFNNNYEEKDRIYDCETCDKKCFTQISLNHHISRHHGKKKLKINSETKEKNKKKLIIKSENQERYCQLCFIMYKEPHFLRMHKEKVHASELDAFEKELSAEDMRQECLKCHKSFYSKNTLDYHMHRKHKHMTENDAFSCRLCYISFPYNSVLKKHLNVLHMDDMHLFDGDLDESLLTHYCQICEKKFVGDHILKYHQKYQHKEAQEKDTFCKLCYVDFKQNSTLKAHRNKIHTTREEIEAFDVKLEKSSLTYKCRFCKKRFLTKNILRYHYLYNHKEERRQDMNCEYCNKVFKWTHGRKRVMENHMKNLHNLEDYKVDENEPVQKENDTVKNFMLLLNSLK